MQTPSWTLQDVQALRHADQKRRERAHALFGRVLESPVRKALSTASTLIGDQVYAPSLRGVSRFMNRYQTTAFADYTLQSGDIICSAYFKAGTNWVMHICYQLAQLGEGEFDHIQDVIAWPDAAEPRYWRHVADRSACPSRTGYHVVKSHLPANLIPLKNDAKFVIVTRDPLDCAASGYHYFAKLFLGPQTPPPDVWLDFFASRQAICGPWQDFTASWWQERHRKNVLFLRFEDMKSDPQKTIRDIADFLGLSPSEAQFKQIEKRTDFKAMRDINHKFYPVRQNMWGAGDGKIIRKGAVGDGGRLFSQAAIDRFRQTIATDLRAANSDFPFYDLLTPQETAD